MTLPHLLLLLRFGAADPAAEPAVDPAADPAASPAVDPVVGPAADSAPEPDAPPLPATPAANPLDAATCSPHPEECVAAASAEFDAHNFTEAVRLFEALIAAHPDVPRYHYFAGLAHESAGDDTAAYVHMRRLLASDADNPAERKRATRRTTAILARTTKLTLKTPAYTDPVNLRLTRLGAAHRDEAPIVIPLVAVRTTGETHELALTPGEWELALDPARLGDMEAVPRRIEVFDGMKTMTATISTRPLRYVLTLELGPARALKRGIRLDLHRINGPTLGLTTNVPGVRRELPPGTWVYQVQARGFLPQTQTIALDGPQSVTLELASKWSEDRRKRLGLGLGLGLAGAGLVTGITGALLLNHADKRLRHLDLASPRPTNEPAAVIAATGSALLGTTIGMWVGAASSTSRSRHLWFAEVAVGAAGMIAGTIWYDNRAKSAPLNFEHMSSQTPTALGDLDKRLLIASGLLGFGAGILTSAVVKLVSNKTSRKPSTLSRRRFRFGSGPHSTVINF